MERPIIQPCAPISEPTQQVGATMKDETKKDPILGIPVHKRQRSRHAQNNSASVSNMADVQPGRIRGEAWNGSWTLNNSTTQTDPYVEEGISLPDFPVLGRRKVELSLDIPIRSEVNNTSNPGIPSVAIVPSTPCGTSPRMEAEFAFPMAQRRGEGEEEGRLSGFTFGRQSPPRTIATPNPPEALHQNDLPRISPATSTDPISASAPQRKKRHSHTRSTSISTRASIIPDLPIRTPSPEERTTSSTTSEERRKTLGVLEGISETWPGNGGGKNLDSRERKGRRRSRVSVGTFEERVEISLPVMDDSEEEVSFLWVLGLCAERC